MNANIDIINHAVARQYEAFPFPDYGLFLPLRWQEGYASHSMFAHAMAREIRGSAHQRPKGGVLIAGCGDVFPSIVSHWEPRSLPIEALDLSATHLKRAKIRCWSAPSRVQFQKLNLDYPLPYARESFSHIDAYGVLHHLANPSQGLQHLSEMLAPGGTLRLMLYNRRSRDWIHQIQKIFALLQLSPYIAQDRKDALHFLEHLARECPALRERLYTLLPELKAKPTRLVDTFFHAREARLDLQHWIQAMQGADLLPLGLFDRYAELDDLPNPLYSFPTLEELDQRSRDRRFENNWELYVIKRGPVLSPQTTTLKVPRSVYLRTAPHAWFQYEETSETPWWDRQVIWQHYVKGLQGESIPFPANILHKLGEPGILRLLRIGAIWPSALPKTFAQDFALHKIHDSMDIPLIPRPIPLVKLVSCTNLLQSIILRKKRDPRLLQWIAKRLDAAQKLDPSTVRES